MRLPPSTSGEIAIMPGNHRAGRGVAVGRIVLVLGVALPAVGAALAAAVSAGVAVGAAPAVAGPASGAVPAAAAQESAPRKRIRDLGIVIGRMAPGPLNAITDVKGVR